MRNNTADGKATAPKKSFYAKHREDIEAYAIIALPFLWFIVFFVLAFLMALGFSFTDMQGSVGSITKVTFDNYRLAFDKSNPLFDPTFLKSFSVSARWMVYSAIGTNFFGLLMGYFLSRIPKGKKVFLVLLYWTALVSAVVGSEIKKKIFASDDTGIMNQLLMMINAIDRPIDWFNQESTAFFALIFNTIFFGYSGKLLIYYASIIGVPETYYEAARLETDSEVKIYIKITLPLIRDALFINIVLSLMDGLKVMAPMQLITNGGNNTMSIVLNLYKKLLSNDMGTACAYAMMLFAMIMVLTIVQLRLNNRSDKVSYE